MRQNQKTTLLRAEGDLPPTFGLLLEHPVLMEDFFKVPPQDKGRMVPSHATTAERVKLGLARLAEQKQALNEVTKIVSRLLAVQTNQPFLLGIPIRGERRAIRLCWRDRDQDSKWITTDDFPAVLASKNLSAELRAWLFHIASVVLHLNFAGRLLHTQDLELRDLAKQSQNLFATQEPTHAAA